MKKRSVTEPTPWEQRMTSAVAALREGEVVSFGEIAARAGRQKASRAAGAFLGRTMHKLPWWRVVYADGRLPPCDPDEQAELLRCENVEVQGNRVIRAPLGRFAE